MAGATAQTVLEDLPPELLAMITDGVPKNDLEALRLVSKMLCAVAEDAFLSAFFTTVERIWAAESLETLLGITSTPRLMRKLDRVVIVFWEVRRVSCRCGREYMYELACRLW